MQYCVTFPESVLLLVVAAVKTMNHCLLCASGFVLWKDQPDTEFVDEQLEKLFMAFVGGITIVL